MIGRPRAVGRARCAVGRAERAVGRVARAVGRARRGVVRRRRAVAAFLAGSLAVAVLGGCASFEDQRGSWNGGVITVATGPTTGGFYQVGGGYADAINRHVKGYEAVVAPTAGSADNLLRLGTGDANVALTFADVAVDALRGEGTFAGPPRRICALAAPYRSYAHLIVRTDRKINKIDDLRGKRISTGAPNSGTEFFALRLLRAAGIDPDRDIVRKSLSLPATTSAMAAGTLDALFWSSGLPTVGITGLLGSAPGKVKFLPLDPLLAEMERAYPGTYVPTVIPTDTYQLAAEVPTIGVNNLIVVDESMPEQLAYELTKLIFVHQKELAGAHPEWSNAQRDIAIQTGAVPLHPGAQRYYREG
ncbi:MAG TPA: TAXI family TRAP transporter solute-binding subunit [Pilimelia sp.]|nr:TAXI family TRAP transporter solute-binding subunit [Pilimelia sp.]